MARNFEYQKQTYDLPFYKLWQKNFDTEISQKTFDYSGKVLILQLLF